jgi:hypothetical protein
MSHAEYKRRAPIHGSDPRYSIEEEREKPKMSAALLARVRDIANVIQYSTESKRKSSWPGGPGGPGRSSETGGPGEVIEAGDSSDSDDKPVGSIIPIDLAQLIATYALGCSDITQGGKTCPKPFFTSDPGLDAHDCSSYCMGHGCQEWFPRFLTELPHAIQIHMSEKEKEDEDEDDDDADGKDKLVKEKVLSTMTPDNFKISIYASHPDAKVFSMNKLKSGNHMMVTIEMMTKLKRARIYETPISAPYNNGYIYTITDSKDKHKFVEHGVTKQYDDYAGTVDADDISPTEVIQHISNNFCSIMSLPGAKFKIILSIQHSTPAQDKALMANDIVGISFPGMPGKEWMAKQGGWKRLLFKSFGITYINTYRE